MVCSVGHSQGFPRMVSPRRLLGWDWTTSTLYHTWPFSSSPKKGQCAVRVTLVAVPFKTVPGLVHLPVAQHRREGASQPGCALRKWLVIAPLPFDLLELFRTRSANYSSPSSGEAGLV